MSDPRPRARLIAHYLPQFHPVPLNDEVWGPGFTEWTNVTRARPLFEGHLQPKLPRDLGFYDLRVPETRAAQAELARAHGIEGFCYWHYWFGKGRMLLERPAQEVLRMKQPDFPFCMGWANESWTDAWRGRPEHVFVEQTYPGEEDDRAHFEYLRPFFEDERYVRVHGKPLFLIFKPDKIPDPNVFVERFQGYARETGFDGLHMVGCKPNFRKAHFYDLDGAAWAMQNSLPALRPPTDEEIAAANAAGRPAHIYDFEEVLPLLPCPPGMLDNDYPSIVTGWDNSPRFGQKAMVLTGYRPEVFQKHVKDVLDRVAHRPYEDRLVFVKSWNEWAEGNYLEPDLRHGLEFLEALKAEVLGESG